MGLEELLLELAEKRGEKKGRREGEKKGQREGEKAMAIAIAHEWKKVGFPVAQIGKYTQLSVRKIEKL
jgi:predicted transposase YdaD